MSIQNGENLQLFELIIQLISAMIVAASLVFLAIQTNAQTDSLRVSAYTAVMDKQMEINNIFIDKPHLYPYFFEKTPINKDTDCSFGKEKGQEENGGNTSDSPTHDCFQQALAIADYHLDFFDLFFTHRNSILTKDQEDAFEACESWEKYIVDRLQNSPILCHRLAEVGYQGKGWYTKYFTEQLDNICMGKTERFTDHGFSCDYYNGHSIKHQVNK